MNSQPVIIKNTIFSNECIGLYFRDVSGGDCRQNTLRDNGIEIVVEKKNQKL